MCYKKWIDLYLAFRIDLYLASICPILVLY
jgi:hypothetical protein